MKIGIIASSNGGAFEKLLDILNETMSTDINFIVVTDRKCGMENVSNHNKIKHIRINENSNRKFSINAREVFKEFGGVDFIILFYTRLITEELFLTYPCFNLHPALLPSFKGLTPIKDAIQNEVKFFGTTLHLVSSGVDEGKIVAQTCMPININDDEKSLSRYAYVQKIYLCLLLVDLYRNNFIKFINNKDLVIDKKLNFTDRCNPKCINENYFKKILEYQSQLGVEVIK